MTTDIRKLIFEKLQALGPRTQFFFCSDGYCKNIRVTEFAPKGLSAESNLTLKARIGLMIFWIYEGVQACCSESIQRGEHLIAFQKLSLDDVLGNWSHILDQFVKYGLPIVIASDNLTQLERELPFEFGVVEVMQTLKYNRCKDHILFLEKLMDDFQAARKNIILR